MYKKLREKTDLKNEDQVYSINEILGKTKKERKNEPETKNFIPNKEIINIVETILEFNRKQQSGEGLKILTPNQRLSRLPITLAQLKAGNNSEKL